MCFHLWGRYRCSIQIVIAFSRRSALRNKKCILYIWSFANNFMKLQFIYEVVVWELTFTLNPSREDYIMMRFTRVSLFCFDKCQKRRAKMSFGDPSGINTHSHIRNWSFLIVNSSWQRKICAKTPVYPHLLCLSVVSSYFP